MQQQIELIYKLMALSNKIKPFSSEIKIIKLMEEVGELSECVTKLSGYKTNNESKKEIMEELWKEICDVFIMIVSLGQEYDMPLDKFNELLKEKTDKWWNKHLKQYITDSKDIPAEYDSPDGKRVEPLKSIEVPFEGDILDIKPPFPDWIKDKIFGQPKTENQCLHASCTRCNGTGIDALGHSCIHMIHCNCRNCTPYSM